MKKLLIIVPHLSTGGLPQFVLKKIELIKDYFDITCIEYKFLSPDFVIQRDKIKQILGNNFYSIDENGINFIDTINNIDPDIIWIEEFSETFINESECDIIYDINRKWRILESTHSKFKQIKRKTPDKFIFVSEYSKNIYSDINVDSCVIEYPIDFKEKQTEVNRNLLGFDSDYKHIITVGLFNSNKNQKYAFDIAERLSNYRIKFHFIGNMADNFIDYWKPLMDNKPSNCIIHGEKDNIDSFLQASDLFLFPSILELNPLVLKESLQYENLPILMNKLDVYGNKYNDNTNITFLSGNLERDSEMVLEILKINK